MGRQKKTLDSGAPYWELAQWLRQIRAEAGVTYRQMAGAEFSAATLSRSDNGNFLPRLEVVEAYASACGVPKGVARRAWQHAASRTAPTVAVGRALRPELVLEPAHLLRVMRQLYLSAGNPSLRELQQRARRQAFGPLPRSTLGDVLAGVRMPSERLLVSYVRTCGEPDHRVNAWLAALSRARAVAS